MTRARHLSQARGGGKSVLPRTNLNRVERFGMLTVLYLDVIAASVAADPWSATGYGGVLGGKSEVMSSIAITS